MYLFAKAGDQEYKVDTAVKGWMNWSHPQIAYILVKEDGTITIGAHIKAGGGVWGSLDDFYLYQVSNQ